MITTSNAAVIPQKLSLLNAKDYPFNRENIDILRRAALDAWDTGKHTLEEEVAKGGGLHSAIIRILAIYGDDTVKEHVLLGRRDPKVNVEISSTIYRICKLFGIKNNIESLANTLGISEEIRKLRKVVIRGVDSAIKRDAVKFL